MTADFSGFSRWATGNLFDNRNRGIFAEWLVGQALGVIEADDVREAARTSGLVGYQAEP